MPPTSFVKATRAGDGFSNTAAEDCWGESFGIDNACYRIINKTTQTINALTGSSPSGYRVTRGILDAVNRDDYTTDSPLVPGQQYELKFPLLTTDYTFPAGHRIGITLVSNYSGYGIPNTSLPVAQVTVDTFKSKVTLPIVGGYEAAIATGAIPDTDPPTLTLPAPVSVEATGPLTPITYGAPSATDGQDPNPTASCLPASGSEFPVGVTPVACEAPTAPTTSPRDRSRSRSSTRPRRRSRSTRRSTPSAQGRANRATTPSARVRSRRTRAPSTLAILRGAGAVGQPVRHEHRRQPYVHGECRGRGRQHELGEPDVQRLLAGLVGLLQPDRQREIRTTPPRAAPSR